MKINTATIKRIGVKYSILNRGECFTHDEFEIEEVYMKIEERDGRGSLELNTGRILGTGPEAVCYRLEANLDTHYEN